MPAQRGHLYLPYGNDQSVRVEYVHSNTDSSKTTVLMPFTVNDAWKREIRAAMQVKDANRTNIRISNAASDKIHLSSRRPTASTPSPEPDLAMSPTPQQNNQRARNVVSNYLQQSGMYTGEHQSALADDSRVHRPDYPDFASQVVAHGGGAPAQAFERAQDVEAITTRGPIGGRDVYLNPNNHTMFTQAHENFHRVEHPSLQAPGSRLTDSTVEGMTEYMTQSATGLDFRTGGLPGRRGMVYGRDTEAVRNAVGSGQYSDRDIQRAYVRGSESPTDRIESAQNGQAAAGARTTTTPRQSANPAPPDYSNPYSSAAAYRGNSQGGPGYGAPGYGAPGHGSQGYGGGRGYGGPAQQNRGGRSQ
ncbi:hypothetical protein AB0368_12150 [Actinoplanes sp. NPDC051475]|uniref:hypothetical protein n=1 Tax=Actinoplanes sp. NPDC051475 TaxID=3157225 RepID=UPI00344EEE1F